MRRINVRPGLRRFFGTIIKSLNPFSYEELVLQSSIYYAYKYLAGLLLLAVLLMAVAGIPVVMDFDSALDKQLDKFNSLKISADFETKDPVLLPTKSPKLIIDSQANRSSIGNRLIYITPSAMEVKPKPCVWFKPACIYYNLVKQTEKKDLTGYSDVLAHKEWYRELAYKIFILMVPGILLLHYVLFGFKYLLITGIAALLGLMICRAIRFEVLMRDVVKVAVFAITLTALVELITSPLKLNLFNIQYAVYLFYFIFGLSRVGYFMRGPKRGLAQGHMPGRRMHDDYIMLE